MKIIVRAPSPSGAMTGTTGHLPMSQTKRLWGFGQRPAGPKP
jgi:hypothetical protein